ncbi:hypothetical protein SAV31267_046580 [Streptomyces avermitilis]|uniref:Uncharacterized protein n=1 Tax=Streptomyces avermitilis TaxID=33903 RepID=A0A4D4MSQ9_STRAX|nr:hypothetical protein SAV31267_046580 [Streptomyces avermitilis]
MFGDAPAGVGGADHHLEGITAAPVREAEGEQRLAAGRAQGAEVVQTQPGATAQHPGEREIAGPSVRGPGAPAVRATPAEYQVGRAVAHLADEGDEQGGVE